jgi:hypothetical protein
MLRWRIYAGPGMYLANIVRRSKWKGPQLGYTFIEWQQQCFMDIFAAFFKFVEEDNASLAFVGAEEIVH